VIVARKRPKIRFLRARTFLLGVDFASLPLFFFIASGGLRYPPSTAPQYVGWIVLAAMVVGLFFLPATWKSLRDELARYTLARREVFAGWKRVLYLGAGLAIAVEIVLLFWPSAGRSVSDVLSDILSELAFPLTVALGVFELAIFWVLDRRVMRQVIRAAPSR